MFSFPGRGSWIQRQSPLGTCWDPSLQRLIISGAGRCQHQVVGSTKGLGIVFLQVSASPVLFLYRKSGILTELTCI